MNTPSTNLYKVSYSSAIGLLIAGHMSTRTYTGTPEQLEAIYKNIFKKNVTLGWWSLPGLVYTVMSLAKNNKNHKSLLAIIAQNPVQ